MKPQQMKRYLLFLFFTFISVVVFAQIPYGYYDDAVGKKGSELKTALHYIIKDADVLNYGSGAGATWSGFTKTDVRPEDGTVWDMYSDNRVNFNGNSPASGMNIEHSFAKSWWGGSKNQAYKDLFHLNPSNTQANSARSNYPMAIITGKKTFDNGVIKVGKTNNRPGGEIDAWEPADEYKGDFARAYMYMVTAYEDFANKWTGNSVNQLDNNRYPVFEQWTIDLFLQWCEQDPVSEKEINRNNEIYKIQGNRNPYIDYPLMAEYVWGKLKESPFVPDGNVDFPYINSPANNSVLDFEKVACLHSETKIIRLKAQNLTDDLSISITGMDAEYFSTVTSVSKEDAEEGVDLIVVFCASNVGEMSAQMNILGGGIAGTKVELKALSSDEFMALPASNIFSNGFTANWTTSAGATGYKLDVFSLQSDGDKAIAQTLLEEEFEDSKLPTYWKSTGFVEAVEGSVRLASSSNPGTITLPQLQNSSEHGAKLTVIAEQYNSDTGAELTATLNGRTLAVWSTAKESKEYSVEFSDTKNIDLSLSAQKGKRVYIDYVKVETIGSEIIPISVVGYPKQLSNMLSYDVVGLEKDSTYYYIVTPLGNSEVESKAISVYVSNNTSTNLDESIMNSIHCFVTSGVGCISNLPIGCSVVLFDLTGKQIYSLYSDSDYLQIKLPDRGIYLLQIKQDNLLQTYKLLY